MVTINGGTTPDGDDWYAIGLSESDVEKMRKGLTKVTELSILGAKCQVIIFCGETEQSMISEMEGVMREGQRRAAACAGASA